jgi:hypothetical protein
MKKEDESRAIWRYCLRGLPRKKDDLLNQVFIAGLKGPIVTLEPTQSSSQLRTLFLVRTLCYCVPICIKVFLCGIFIEVLRASYTFLISHAQIMYTVYKTSSKFCHLEVVRRTVMSSLEIYCILHSTYNGKQFRCAGGLNKRTGLQ